MMKIIALLIGGFVGTVLRFGLSELIPSVPEGFPLETLIINLAGCLFLGWFFTITVSRLHIRPELRLGLGTGLTGAFTTFSTFSVQSVTLIQNSEWSYMSIYIVTSILGGIGLAYIGTRIALIASKNSKRGTLS